jgi:hypothetical protein
MQYLNEIRDVVTEYGKISAGLSELEKMTQLLESRKTELESALVINKQKEKALIDKIEAETGKAPDYYQIMLKLNETT